MKTKLIVFLVAIIAIAGSAAYLFLSPNLAGPMSHDKAVERLAYLKKKVDWAEHLVQRRAQVQLGAAQDLTQMLPNIDQFPLVVQPPSASGDVVVEIFASTEKSGDKTDGWMTEVANDFNAQDQQLKNGKHARVAIRKIASGTAHEFIGARKYTPDAFSPSSHLWIRMVTARGVNLTPIREKLVGNIAGIVMKTTVADKIKAKYGSLEIKNLIDAVVQGNLAMGYTDPFASSTGLNLLVTVLATFAGGKEDKMLEPTVVSAFEGFQKGVPFVSQTTMQMRESVEKDGSLDAFVMEYQTFVNTKVLQAGYEFIPFGVRHDNPLYAVGKSSAEKMEALEKFAAFAEQAKAQKLASDYGFNPTLDYKSAFPTPSGETLIQAQRIWKQKKDAGKTVAAIFLCDVSGSMNGPRLNALKKSLIGGSQFIAPENEIGLVLFNQEVSVVLPVKKFDLGHKAMFQAAVEDMSASGQTAMYNGVVISLAALLEEKKQDPNTKVTLFVLTDGETNAGWKFEDVRPVIEALGVPIYTIGYEANLAVLQELSAVVEAASFNANESDVQYKIGSLLNAQM